MDTKKDFVNAYEALYLLMVPVIGLEPIRCCQRQILSLLRLPIPPHRRVNDLSQSLVCHQHVIL